MMQVVIYNIFSIQILIAVYFQNSVIQWNFLFSYFQGESESEVTQSCPTLCDPVDYNPPGSSVHGILQARILEWVAISFSRGSSGPRDQTQIFHTADRFFTIWATK